MGALLRHGQPSFHVRCVWVRGQMREHDCYVHESGSTPRRLSASATFCAAGHPFRPGVHRSLRSSAQASRPVMCHIGRIHFPQSGSGPRITPWSVCAPRSFWMSHAFSSSTADRRSGQRSLRSHAAGAALSVTPGSLAMSFGHGTFGVAALAISVAAICAFTRLQRSALAVSTPGVTA